MTIDPRFISAFSEVDAFRMRKAYLLAEERFCSSRRLDSVAKCKLAAIILYICTDEKRHPLCCRLTSEELAQEALEVLVYQLASRKAH